MITDARKMTFWTTYFLCPYFSVIKNHNSTKFIKLLNMVIFMNLKRTPDFYFNIQFLKSSHTQSIFVITLANIAQF